MDVNELISKTVDEIKSKEAELQIATRAISDKRVALENEYYSRNLKIWEVPALYWRFVGVHDGLSKFLEFCSEDIANVDNLSLTQKARYFCDSIMWVKHLCDPKKDPLEYYEHLLRGKSFHYETVIEHLQNEIDQLKQIQPLFSLMLFKQATRRVKLGKPRLGEAEIEKLIDDFDKSLSKSFSIYRKPAIGNYELYAQIVEDEIILPYKEDLAKLENEIKQFEGVINRKIRRKHNSAEFAKSLQMKAEYEFLFRLASQHLHATPVSMSTEMRSISNSERLIFLEYIRAKIYDVLSSSLYLQLGFRAAQPKIGLGPFFSATRRKPKK